MKMAIMCLAITVAIMGFSAPSYASDWDKAGKVLAVIEGLRILTGGKIDPIGNVAGINQERGHSEYRAEQRHTYARNYSHFSRRAWVPHYAWKERYVPKHEEYDNECGNVIVEGHYIRYKAEDGRHWEQGSCIR